MIYHTHLQNLNGSLSNKVIKGLISRSGTSTGYNLYTFPNIIIKYICTGFTVSPYPYIQGDITWQLPIGPTGVDPSPPVENIV